jgi:TldD protein
MLVEPDVAERVIKAALRRGGDFAEIFAEERSATGVALDDRRVEEVSSGRDRGAGVRVVVGETTGYAHTADLSEKGLLGAAEAASAVARRGGASAVVAVGEVAPDLVASLDVAVHEGSKGANRMVTVHPSEVPKSRKVELLFLADEVARASGAAVSQVSAGYGDSSRLVQVMNSEGLHSLDVSVRTRLSVTVVALGDTGMQTGYETVARSVGFELLAPERVEQVASEAARRALVKLSARPAPSGELPVVLASGSGGILFHEACGHGLEADHIMKDASVFVGRLGEQVASPLVTLVDDGSVAGEWGSFAIDDEGRPAARNVLIEGGVLTSYMWDFLRARKDERSSTGNGRRQSYRHLPMVRMTNTFILGGESTPEEIVAGTKRGVYVAKLGGGQVNTATGDFVFGTTEAYMIEDGRVTEPLRDANLIGNGPDILRRVDAVASDFSMTPGTCGKDGQSVPVGCGQPTLRVSAVTVGGTAGA